MISSPPSSGQGVQVCKGASQGKCKHAPEVGRDASLVPDEKLDNGDAGRKAT